MNTASKKRWKYFDIECRQFEWNEVKKRMNRRIESLRKAREKQKLMHDGISRARMADNLLLARGSIMDELWIEHWSAVNQRCRCVSPTVGSGSGHIVIKSTNYYDWN